MFNGREPIIDNPQLRTAARLQLKGNWGRAIITFLVYVIIVNFAATIPVLGIYLVGGPLTLGLCRFFINLKRGQRFDIENLFDGFQVFLPSFLLSLLCNIFVFLWSLLLIVPGIIAALNYSMAFFILNDNPELSAIEAIRKSKEMMRGHKGRLFVLFLSFTGWILLGALALGIGLLVVVPYIYLTLANFYDNLKNNQDPISKKAKPTFNEDPPHKEEDNPLFTENPNIF